MKNITHIFWLILSLYSPILSAKQPDISIQTTHTFTYTDNSKYHLKTISCSHSIFELVQILDTAYNQLQYPSWYKKHYAKSRTWLNPELKITHDTQKNLLLETKNRLIYLIGKYNISPFDAPVYTIAHAEPCDDLMLLEAHDLANQYIPSKLTRYALPALKITALVALATYIALCAKNKFSHAYSSQSSDTTLNTLQQQFNQNLDHLIIHAQETPETADLVHQFTHGQSLSMVPVHTKQELFNALIFRIQEKSSTIIEPLTQVTPSQPGWYNPTRWFFPNTNLALNNAGCTSDAAAKLVQQKSPFIGLGLEAILLRILQKELQITPLIDQAHKTLKALELTPLILAGAYIGCKVTGKLVSYYWKNRHKTQALMQNLIALEYFVNTLHHKTPTEYSCLERGTLAYLTYKAKTYSENLASAVQQSYLEKLKALIAPHMNSAQKLIIINCLTKELELII